MIDDATYSIIIFGYGLDAFDNLVLLVADPHIADNRKQPFAGLYQATFDMEGKQLGNTLSTDEKKSMLYPSYQSLEFLTASWMVLFARC